MTFAWVFMANDYFFGIRRLILHRSWFSRSYSAFSCDFGWISHFFCKNKSLKISRNRHLHWVSELKTTFFEVAVRFYITVGFLGHIQRFLVILAELATFCKNKSLKISRNRHMHWVSELKTTFFEFAVRFYITVGFLAHIQRFLVIWAELAFFPEKSHQKSAQIWPFHWFTGVKTSNFTRK